MSERSLSNSDVEKSTTESEESHTRTSFDPAIDPNYDPAEDDVEDDSPYPEVRCAVANFDDPSMPASTLRAWALGLAWAILLPGVNQFYHHRYPSILVPEFVAILLAFPLGRLWARLMPRWTIFGLSLNPGEFTIKEHVLITVMARVGSRSAYATDIVATQRITYQQMPSFTYSWLLVISTQLIGFSAGGITRKFLVLPSAMIWPTTLVSCALFNTLHSSDYSGIGSHSGIKRERFFLIAFGCAAVWYIFPGFLFEALSVFTWVCWIAPSNVKVNQLFGYHSGLGLSILTFDWSQIAYIGSPLVTPWWSEANLIVGYLIFYWMITPICYYANAWGSQYLPMSSSSTFDNMGKVYNVSRVLNENGRLDEEAYHAYSPPFLAATFAISYGTQFASITATIVHALLYFRRPIFAQLQRSDKREPLDVHARLMSVYPEVPQWWYACVFLPTFAAAVICIQVWNNHMTVWALVIALMISLVFVVPIGMIKAITNREVGLNVITELIIGYMLPGRPIAMMMFKTWGYISESQALVFVADMKLGHYMKVPPRAMFWAQLTAGLLAGTVQLAVQSWMFAHIEDMCQPDQKQNFICATTQVFSTASVLWGLVGPQALYSAGRLYYGLSFFFLAGALLPLLFWLLSRRYPNTWLSYVNFPLIFAGLGLSPPATAVNFIPWAIVGYIFQNVIRRTRPSWWAKYNYVLSAALDAGTAVATVLIFFCLQYPLNGRIEEKVETWWGNTVFKNTADWKRTPLKTIPPGKTFGPNVW